MDSGPSNEPANAASAAWQSHSQHLIRPADETVLGQATALCGVSLAYLENLACSVRASMTDCGLPLSASTSTIMQRMLFKGTPEAQRWADGHNLRESAPSLGESMCN